MKCRPSCMLLAISLFYVMPVTAKVLSPKAQLSRCYTQLTGKALPLGYPATAQVVSGAKKASDVCLELLNDTELDSTAGTLINNNPESKNILNNLNSFHKSWFPTNAADQMQDYTDEFGLGTSDIFDFTESSLMITKSLFETSGNYATVVTSPEGVVALRKDSAFAQRATNFNVTFAKRAKHGNNAFFDSNFFNFIGLSDVTVPEIRQLPKIEVGELIGIKNKMQSVLIPNTNLYPQSNNVSGATIPNYIYNPDIYKSFGQGGGILGIPSFLMLNFGHTFGLKMNGSTKLPRRWSLTIMNSLLCAEMPALRESDILNDVRQGSTTPFRNGSACMRCHGTLDRMALTARNLVITNSNYIQNTQIGKDSHLISSFTPTKGARAWPSEAENDFHLTNPDGALYYRSMSGRLVNEPVGNISQLGGKIAQQEDYYTCAAKRYFNYFTGINVSLYDRSNPENAALNKALTPQEAADRKFVEQLGADFKDARKHNGSLKGLISDIIKSNYYMQSDFRGQ
jgi:hypothetical protein